jgi:hypothetical protein
MNGPYVSVSKTLPTLRVGETAFVDCDSLIVDVTLSGGRVIKVPIRDILHEARAVNLVTRVRDDEGKLASASHQRGRFVGVSTGSPPYKVDTDTFHTVTAAVQARLRKKKRPADDDVEIVRERTVEERNAEGFANAEVID